MSSGSGLFRMEGRSAALKERAEELRAERREILERQKPYHRVYDLFRTEFPLGGAEVIILLNQMGEKSVAELVRNSNTPGEARTVLGILGEMTRRGEVRVTEICTELRGIIKTRGSVANWLRKERRMKPTRVAV